VPDDAQLFGDLREMWQRTDPMPHDLPDRVIAAIAAEDLDLELLTLTASESVGVRGGEAQVLECTVDDLTLAVRISEEPDGTRRIDGWTEGVREVDLLADAEADTRTTSVSDAGRFEFDNVPPGPVRLRLRSTGRDFETNEFEV
jgi:hypothetical protein